MPCSVVVGAQWGDEGKAKVIDYLCSDAKYIVRYQGGANAGHTVVVGKEKFVFHLIPSGILHKEKVCVVGNGVVLDPEAILKEIDSLKEIGVEVSNRLFISNHCHLIMPYHKLMDVYKEEKLKGNKIGTTGRGIGPCYSDKIGRAGIRLIDLYDKNLKDQIASILDLKNFFLKDYYGKEALDVNEIYEEYISLGEKLKPFMANTSHLLNTALKNGEEVLLEGAQGTLLDIDFGTYPFVTSSNSTSGGACTGSGIPPTKIDRVYGVMKPYCTRVGSGYFPTEAMDEDGEKLQEYGHEFGATTGRRRRCGWLDAVLGNYAISVNGIDHIFLTKLDVLDHFDTIKVCVGYEMNGEKITDMSLAMRDLSEVKPIYKEFAGWKTPTTEIRNYNDLPDNTKKYIESIQELMNTHISHISVGPERSETIECP